jgi:hypothetical protein
LERREYVNELDVLSLERVRRLERIRDADIERRIRTEQKIDRLLLKREMDIARREAQIDRLVAVDYIPTDPGPVFSDLRELGYFIPERIDRDFLASMGLNNVVTPEEKLDARINNRLFRLDRELRNNDARIRNQMLQEERFMRNQQNRILNVLIRG